MNDVLVVVCFYQLKPCLSVFSSLYPSFLVHSRLKRRIQSDPVGIAPLYLRSEKLHCSVSKKYTPWCLMITLANADRFSKSCQSYCLTSRGILVLRHSVEWLGLQKGKNIDNMIKHFDPVSEANRQADGQSWRSKYRIARGTSTSDVSKAKFFIRSQSAFASFLSHGPKYWETDRTSRSTISRRVGSRGTARIN